MSTVDRSAGTGPSRREFLGRLARGGAGLAVAGGALPLLSGQATGAVPRITVLTGATLIDGTGRPPRRNATVVLADDRIVAVGSLDRTAIPAGATVVHLHGKYVIPGLWDMHVHTSPIPEIYPPLYVVNGVTGIREMYGFSPALHDLRDRIESGSLLGPRMVIASTIIDGPHSIHESSGAAVVETAAEARAAVRTAVDKGADFVKGYSFLHPEPFAALAEEARRVGLPFAGHVPDRVSAWTASSTGLDCFEHLFGTFFATSTKEGELRRRLTSVPVDPEQPWAWMALARELERQSLASHSPRRAAAFFHHLRRNGTWQSPTLNVLHAQSLPIEEFDLADPRLEYLPPGTAEFWLEQLRYTAPSTPEEIENLRRLFAAQQRMVRDLDEAGVQLIAGTDSNNPFCYPGFGLHDELALLVDAGLSPMRALQLATRDAARYLGRERTAGTVAPGKVADLVVLEDDPLADIRNTQRIHSVVSRGRYLSPEKRTEMLADIKKAASEAAGTAAPAACCGTRS
ncbi:amidohydrolase family protein [Amycolatopsis cihanbeyliensis]|uniref:Amidohydrolase family protein n=1 Tax=Amycolatopsis cihanbeyliensis TaxID=1128664 RepID=A0A542DFY3_AMYCI|nr:amidohydrolase family protein [Amycolatopsis cihanbeyliensis]TQJ01993.1 amidohydrolase family protein [Amycolatopsis cihanbeyliensis]